MGHKVDGARDFLVKWAVFNWMELLICCVLKQEKLYEKRLSGLDYVAVDVEFF